MKRQKIIEMLDVLEEECTLIDGDSGEGYLDIPIEDWKALRKKIEELDYLDMSDLSMQLDLL